METIIALIVAVIIIAIIWKVLTGIIRTLGLVVILAGAAYFAYNNGVLG